MQQRRGTALQWTTSDPILNAGEIGYETDTGISPVQICPIDGISEITVVFEFTIKPAEFAIVMAGDERANIAIVAKTLRFIDTG